MTTSSERERTESPEALLRRPRWTRVRTVALIRREVREFLPSSALEVLLSEGETLLEGGAELVHDGESSRVFATMMVTADLEALAGRLHDRADAVTAARVTELLEGHSDLEAKLRARVRSRLPALVGRQDISRWTITVDPQVRADGTSVMIDADIVAYPGDGKVG